MFYKHSRGSNVLTYEELSGLLFHMGSGNKDNTNPVFELAKTGQGYITTHGMTQKFSWLWSIWPLFNQIMESLITIIIIEVTLRWAK